MKRYIAPIIVTLALTFPLFGYGATWQFDPDHSSFQFKVRHLTVSNVKGSFGKFRASATVDDKDISNLKIEVTIDATSVDTGHAKRDEHLRGPDFFDVTKYPTISFVSKKVEGVDTSKLKILGDLTIRGVTREITLDVDGPTQEVKDPWGGFRRGASAAGRINRKDFGITWNAALDAGGFVVGDEVDIYVEVELVRK